MSAHCTNCGKKIAEGDTWCPRCGASTLLDGPKPTRYAPAREPMPSSRRLPFPLVTYLAAVLPAAFVTIRVYMASPEGGACSSGFFDSPRCLAGAADPLFFYWFIPGVAYGVVLVAIGQAGEGGRTLRSFLALGVVALTWVYGLAVLVLFGQW